LPFLKGEENIMPESIRISDGEFSILRAEKQLTLRSIGAQAEYWMRIGRAIEKSPAFDYQNIKNTLEGLNEPENLTAEEQAVFMDEFAASMHEETDEQKAFFAKQIELGIGVGLDENDDLVYQSDMK
jgi:hypothetical protein